VDECWRLLRQSGMSTDFESTALVPRYSAWLAGGDWTPAYRRHRANLQLIGLADDRRWVLKSPSHLAALDALMSVYPDALLLVTHRDPVVAVASACSLSARATTGWSTTFTGAAIAAPSWGCWPAAGPASRPPAGGTTRPSSWTSSTRRSSPTRSAPSGGLRRARPELDARGGGGGCRRRRGVPARPRRPAHRYRLADYGLRADEVRAAFG